MVGVDYKSIYCNIVFYTVEETADVWYHVTVTQSQQQGCAMCNCGFAYRFDVKLV